jgi:hypothetical protein
MSNKRTAANPLNALSKRVRTAHKPPINARAVRPNGIVYSEMWIKRLVRSAITGRYQCPPQELHVLRQERIANWTIDAHFVDGEIQVPGAQQPDAKHPFVILDRDGVYWQVFGADFEPIGDGLFLAAQTAAPIDAYTSLGCRVPAQICGETPRCYRILASTQRAYAEQRRLSLGTSESFKQN